MFVNGQNETKLSKQLKVAEIWSIFYTFILNFFRVACSSAYSSYKWMDESEESRIARELSQQKIIGEVSIFLIIISLIPLIHMSILLNKIINEYKTDEEQESNENQEKDLSNNSEETQRDK